MGNSSMKKQQLKEYCEAEFENTQAVLSELFRIAASDKKIYSNVELAASATFIHNFYNGIENILKRIMIYENVKIKDSSTWHKDLLKASLDRDIISIDLYNSLSGYLSFRHYFVHSYSFNLRWNELKPLIDRIRNTQELFKNSVERYINNLP